MVLNSSDIIVEAKGVRKRYGRIWAIKEASFTLSRGQIIGFLGPNGAGKTTLLRILACYIPPTEGKVTINGYDILENSSYIRKLIGYMPENNPLYLEMRVYEYLKFRGGLKGLNSKQIKQRIEEVTVLCGLSGVLHKLIGTLSKGFRQRVGLADVLLHEPELLILDEPTIGLDPLQVRCFRDLLRSLAGKHTIIFSSHILTEIEQLCNRIILIHEGQVIDLGTWPIDTHSVIFVHIMGPVDTIKEKLSMLDWIESLEVKAIGVNQCYCNIIPKRNENFPTIRLAQLAIEHQWLIIELYQKYPTLEEIFIEQIQGY